MPRRRHAAHPRRPASVRRGGGLLAVLALVALGLALLAFIDGLRTSEPPWRVAAPVAATEAQQHFIRSIGTVARTWRSDVGLTPSLVTAMAINESGWGQSSLTRRAHNYFGIKADSGDGPAGSVLEPTQEVLDGRTVNVWSRFRAYRSLEESVRDLGRFLHMSPRYQAVWARAADARAAARALANAGYATDPTWADKLIRLIDAFSLEDLDGVP